jgi:hypothetical protein
MSLRVSTFLKISLLFTVLCIVLFALGLAEVGPLTYASSLWAFSMRVGVLGIPTGGVLILTAWSLVRRKRKLGSTHF